MRPPRPAPRHAVLRAGIASLAAVAPAAAQPAQPAQPAQAPAPSAAAAADALPPTLEACYVPATGTVYRISTTASPAPGAPAGCLNAAHVRFVWNQQGVQGPPGPKGDKGDPGGAGAIGPDLSLSGTLGVGGATSLNGGLTLGAPAGFSPTAALLQLRDAPGGGGALAFGVSPAGAVSARTLSLSGNAAVAGLTATGAVSAGAGILAAGNLALALPSGAGTRFVWAPQKGALRAGQVDGAQWDDANVGQHSIGLGVNTLARGLRSVALGAGATATGEEGVALGQALASGFRAVAGGDQTWASGASSTAFGFSTTASGNRSTALGARASTNGKRGAFVYGDDSSADAALAGADNEFLVRAAGGVRLRTSGDLAKGCDVDGQGNLSCSGSVRATGGLAIGPDLTLPGRLGVGGGATVSGGLLANATGTLAVPTGAGRRFLWAPQRGALRAGEVTTGRWDEENLGLASFAAGSNSMASAYGTIALGTYATATSDEAVAIGQTAVADGQSSVAIGHSANTNGMFGSVVIAAAAPNTASIRSREVLVHGPAGIRLRTADAPGVGCEVTNAGTMSCSGGVSAANTIRHVTSDWHDVGGASGHTASLPCPGGYAVVGGGVETEGAERLDVQYSYPDVSGNRWRAKVNAPVPFDGGRMRLFAVCMRN